MYRPRRRRMLSDAMRQRALGVTSLLVGIGMCVAILAAPILGPAMTQMGPGEALRAVVLSDTLMLGLLAIVVLR